MAILEEKLDKLIELFQGFAAPMEASLAEIQASNRARKIMFIAMLSCASVIAALTYHTLHNLGHLSDTSLQLAVELKTMQTQNKVTAEQLKKLIELAEDNASTPEIAQQLQTMKAAVQVALPISDGESE